MCVVILGNRRRLVRGVGLAWSALGLGSVLLGVVSSPAVAATGSWSTPVDLSAAGGNAQGPQISVDAAGNAIAVWQRGDGSNDTVQTSSSTDGGVTWSTAEDLSAAGVIAQNPQITADAKGNVFAIWRRYDGNDNIVQVSSLTLPSLADTGATSGAVTTTLGVGAGLLAAGALALVLLRRRLARS